MAASEIATKRLDRRRTSLAFPWGSLGIVSSLSVSIMTSFHEPAIDFRPSVPKAWAVERLSARPSFTS